MRSDSSALGKQVGGSHYVNRGIQPVQFWAANKWDAFSGSILKYLTRWRDKAGVTDLEKALHFAELRFEIGGALALPADNPRRLSMNVYIRENGISNVEDTMFLLLERWVNLGLAGNADNQPYQQFHQELSNYIIYCRENDNG